MTHMRKTVGTLVCAGLLATGVVVGTGEAHAAATPTIAVTQSGNTDWQITFDRGAARTASCDVKVGGKNLGHTQKTTLTLKGDQVRPGRHTVQVVCGHRASPQVWVYAPRNQINDIGTWFSSNTTGAFGI